MSSSSANRDSMGSSGGRTPDTSMGALFQQRRANKQQQQQLQQQQESSPSNRKSNIDFGTNKKSLLEIQAEQARDRNQSTTMTAATATTTTTTTPSQGSRFPRNSGGGMNHYTTNHGSPYQHFASNNHNNSSGGAGGYNNNNQYHHYHHHDHHHHHRSDGGSGGSGARRQRPMQPDRSKLPLEHGCVCSLKDSFGFIKSADRVEDIFFHFSEVLRPTTAAGSSGRSPGGANAFGAGSEVGLKLGDEVEYRVGSAPSRGSSSSNSNNNSNHSGSGGEGGEKLAAFQVRVVPPGTVVWETEDEPGRRFRGLIERPARSDRSNNSNSNNGINASAIQEGMVRILVEKEQVTSTMTTDIITDDGVDSTTETTVVATRDGPLVRYTLQDYQPDNVSNTNHSRHDRISRGDLIEFNLVTERRTKDKYCRNIKLLLTERERTRQDEERRMMENATVEHGIVTALKGEYGFLKSNKRREKIYFHYSSVEMLDQHDSDGLVLEEGQDMKFLVVEESSGGGGGGSGGGGGGEMRRRISARKVTLQPRGSVRFYDVLATGMTGVVTLCPQPIDSGHALEQHGRIRLAKPVTDRDEDGTETIVHEVYLRSKHSPGGNFSYRGGSAVGLWIQVGDTLLFDVIKDFVDGSCRAVPTKYLTPRENPVDMDTEMDTRTDSDEDSSEQAIHLISLTLAGRSEGVINTVKDAFGFIHFAERPVDAHFKLFQVLPDALQRDLRRHMGLENVDAGSGAALQLSVGAEVQFDLSVHGKINSNTGTGTGSGRHNRGGRAQQQQQQQQQQHERENVKAQRILLLPPGTIRHSEVLLKGTNGVVSKEDAKQPFAGIVDLETPASPMSFEQRHPLVAQMIISYLSDEDRTIDLEFHDIQSAKEDEIVIKMVESIGKGRLTWSYSPLPDESTYPGRLCIRKVPKTDYMADGEENDQKRPHAIADASDLGADETDTKQDATSGDDEADNSSISKSRNNLVDDNVGETASDKAISISNLPKKKKDTKPKSVKSIRFDKGSLAPELRDDIPPAAGDLVVFDVVQSRRTGQVNVENMKMVQRHIPQVDEAEDVTMGIVKEIVPNRKFGFISVLDEGAKTQESLFFNLSSVVASDGAVKSSPKKPTLRKGDEVKFNIGTEKNGKHVALNIQLLPKGTIPSKADKNVCRGIILLSPSHTSLKNTPLRHAISNTSQQSDKSSRWDGVDEDRKKQGSEESATEKGCILLIDDPTGMFQTKADKSHGTESIESETASDDGIVGPTRRHLRYKNGALAIHGPGSSSAMDDSSQPRRGDMVSFSKAKSGAGVRDIRIVSRGASKLLRGRLECIQIEEDVIGETRGQAKFIATTQGQEEYYVDLAEVISCDAAVLKDRESVEVVLHDGRVYGVCRTVDLYLESKLGLSHKERPKLNLTVKKDRGGKIMAQTMMAKGPDGTNGFTLGWTTRQSKFFVMAESNGFKKISDVANGGTATTLE